jgi:hypothetical protein
VIAARDLNAALVEALPELGDDFEAYRRKRVEDPEFTQSFFNYSFLPTLQVALDQNVEYFSARAFALIEQLILEGDADIQAILRDEFFDYGPVCEKWMKRARSGMGDLTRKATMG